MTPSEILNILQLLWPLVLLVLVALGVAGLLLYRLGRAARTPAPRQQAMPERPRAQHQAEQPGQPRQPQQPQQPPPPQRPAADQAGRGDRPAAAAPAAAAVPALPAAARPALPLQADLLLVDDSAVVRAKLRRLFEPAGYRIALAQDGEAALALLRQGRYALLITDLEMPRLDGVGLIQATLALPGCAGMPILAITGHEDLQSQLNRLQVVTGIYRKPWLDDELLGHVQALVVPALVVPDLQPAVAGQEA